MTKFLDQWFATGEASAHRRTFVHVWRFFVVVAMVWEGANGICRLRPGMPLNILSQTEQSLEQRMSWP